jgi:hydrogenase maturation protease
VKGLVVGVGNQWRGDDGIGLVIAERLAEDGVAAIGLGGEPAALVDALGDAEAVVVVDAVRSGAAAGTIVRWDASSEPLPLAPFRCSTHALGVAEAIELARALGRLAPRVVVYGIEVADVGTGAALSAPVEQAVAGAVDAVRSELRRLAEETA